MIITEEIKKYFEDIYLEYLTKKFNRLEESAPEKVAIKLNKLSKQWISDKSIDYALKTYIYGEITERDKLPIGNGDFVDLHDASALKKYAEDILKLITAKGAYYTEVELKLKLTMNDIFKGEGEHPFEELIENPRKKKLLRNFR